MKTLKIKFAFFSVLAVLALSTFLTSCSQDSIEEIVAPTTIENNEVLKSILLASKGKLTKNADTYSISLSKEDLDTEVYEAITNRQTLAINEGLVISAEDTKDIFCVSEGECIVEGDYIFGHQDISLTSSDNLEERGCICFFVRVGIFWVWVCVCT